MGVARLRFFHLFNSHRFIFHCFIFLTKVRTHSGGHEHGALGEIRETSLEWALNAALRLQGSRWMEVYTPQTSSSMGMLTAPTMTSNGRPRGQ